MKRLMEYLPEKYEHSPETTAFQEALQPEIDMLWTARDEFRLQLNPHTATGWGLKRWEDALGLRPAAAATLEQRRSKIVAKIRGMGTVTVELLKAVVESFLTTNVEVVEYPRDNWVEIYFSIGDEAYLPDEPEMVETLLEILPAHLGMNLILRTYRTIRSNLLINFGGAIGTNYVLPPHTEDRTSREDVPVAFSGFLLSALTGTPPDTRCASVGRQNGSGGAFARVHIKPKRID